MFTLHHIIQLAADSDAVWKILCQIAVDHNVPIKDKGEEEAGEEEETDSEADAAPCLTYKHAEEITRYGGVELHNISSLLGGVAAQVRGWPGTFTPLFSFYHQTLSCLI